MTKYLLDANLSPETRIDSSIQDRGRPIQHPAHGKK